MNYLLRKKQAILASLNRNLTGYAEGTSLVSLNRTKNVPPINYQIYGNATQATTPTPLNPATINLLGDKTVNLFQMPTQDQIFTPYPTTFEPCPRTFYTKVPNYIKGLTPGNYYYGEAGLNFVTIEGNSITFSPHQLGAGVGFAMALEEGETYTISWQNSPTCDILFYPEEEMPSPSVQCHNGEHFTVPENTKYTVIIFTYGVDQTTTISNIQVEKGVSAHPYEPYGKYKIGLSINGTTNNIYLNRQLCTDDYIDATEGKLYIKDDHIVGLNSPGWTWTLMSTNPNIFQGSYPNILQNPKIMCNAYKVVNKPCSQLSDFECCAATNNTPYIYFNDPRYTSAEEFKSSLSQVELYYTQVASYSTQIALPTITLPQQAQTTINIGTTVAPSQTKWWYYRY